MASSGPAASLPGAGLGSGGWYAMPRSSVASSVISASLGGSSAVPLNAVAKSANDTAAIEAVWRELPASSSS